MKKTTFATALAQYMGTQLFSVDLLPGALNIVYVEGMNPDFTLNDDALDGWNDLRMLLTMTDWGWDLVHIAVATTEPGKVYTQRPMNAKGAARIAFGQYTAWRMGKHQMAQPALVQVSPVKVHRDLNRNGIRDRRDRIDTGVFGINQHSTAPNFQGKMVGRFSAGCLVGRDYAQHLEFLELLAKDARYLQNPMQHLFTTTILAGDELHKFLQTWP